MEHVVDAPAVRRRPLLQLLSVVRQSRWALGLGLVFAILEHGFAVVAAGVMGWMIGAAAERMPVSALGFATRVLGALVLASAVAAWQSSHFAHVFAYRHQAALRLRLFDGLERSAPRHLFGQRTGDLGATVMGDVGALESFFAHLAVNATLAIVVGVGAVVYLGLVHPFFAAIAALGFTMASLVPGWMALRVKAVAKELRDELGALNADVVDGVQGMRELVLFQQVGAFEVRLAERTRHYAELQKKLARAAGVQQATTHVLATLTSLAILLLAVHLVVTRAIAFPTAVVAVAVAGAALRSVHEAIAIAGGLAPLRASANRVLTVLEQPAAVAEVSRAAASHATLGETLPSVRFDTVHFSYEARAARHAECDTEVLRGATFEVNAGETLALVGASGAGKSTCMHLLLRLWDVDRGAILIGDRDVRTMASAELRRLVAVIPQDVYLFHGTLADNLRLGKPDASDADIRAALRGANAHEFVERLPSGYDTVVGERGALLSGGQRQRIAIARALLMDAPILVMDEAASSLDSANERAIQGALRTARGGRTTIVIAHRLSTIRSADRIVVLDQGRIAETGTHDALVRRGGVYARVTASLLESSASMETRASEARAASAK